MWIQGTSPPASRPGLAQILLEKIGLLAPNDGSDQGLIYLAVEVSFLTVGCVLVVGGQCFLRSTFRWFKTMIEQASTSDLNAASPTRNKFNNKLYKPN